MSKPPSVLATAVTPPNPEEVRRALSNLAEKSREAALAFNDRIASGVGPLPFDPFDIVRAFAEFGAISMCDPASLARAQQRGFEQWTALNRAFVEMSLGGTPEPVIAPEPGDRRFSDPAWNDEPIFQWLKQAYLLASKQLRDFIADVD
ncbi:MAG: hypothetical protein JOZ27_06390, partial [Caulobacteraceae bacterium]|nr:hypothetical protein [Caulobacteraceae bacterium]